MTQFKMIRVKDHGTQGLDGNARSINYSGYVTSGRSEQGTSCISWRGRQALAPEGELAHLDASKHDQVSPVDCRQSSLDLCPDNGQVAPPEPGRGGSLPVPKKQKSNC